MVDQGEADCVAYGIGQNRRNGPAIDVFGPLPELVVQPLEPFEGGEIETEFRGLPGVKRNGPELPEDHGESLLGFTVDGKRAVMEYVRPLRVRGASVRRDAIRGTRFPSLSRCKELGSPFE